MESGKQTYLLLGSPVGHSISPELHAFLFGISGVNAEYRAVDIHSPELAAFVTSMRGQAGGYNCTIPHKENIIPLLDELDDRARVVQSVNTVRDRGGILRGYNTDVDGFTESLKLNGVDLKGKKVLILGGGGTAKALAYECVLGGAAVTFAGRDREKIAPLAERLRQLIPAGGFEVLSLSGLMGSYDILVNCTPVGMYPNETVSPVDLNQLDGLKCVFDVIYNPPLTPLLRQAQSRGIPAISGLSMLAIQALRAQEIWTGYRFSDEEKRKAVDFAEGVVVRRRLRDKYGKGNIVLTGFMGSGKSTVGPLLAQKLNMNFIDMDEEIVKKAGMSISEFFRRKGEKLFRAMETDAALDFCGITDSIIACGGGAVTVSATADALKRAGVVVFLHASPEKILSNLSGAVDERPLLKSDDPQKTVKELYNKRFSTYKSVCDIAVPSDGTPREVCAEIVGLI